jgi:hypothetical protein
MSIWPIFITGVVGVAGIAGTIFAARMSVRSQTANLLISINEERRKALRTEKRQVYADFLSCIHDVVNTVMVAYYSGDLQNLMDEILRVGNKINIRLGELELIGGEEVLSQARAFANYVGDPFVNLILAIKQGDKKITEIKPASVVMDEMQAQLLKAMRADLGGEIQDSITE